MAMTLEQEIEYLTSNGWKSVIVSWWVDPRNHEWRRHRDAVMLQRDRDSWQKEIAAIGAHAFDPSPLDLA